MKILGQGPSEIISSVEFSVRKVCALLRKEGEPSKPRGYFTVVNIATSAPVLIAKIGKVPLDKLEKYQLYSREKALRLSIKMKSHNHMSSWESRIPEDGKWGGAVFAGRGLIFSFSGLPELADEAAMLDVVRRFHDFFPQAREIAKKSNNKYYFLMHP